MTTVKIRFFTMSASVPGSGEAVAHHRDEDEEREDDQRAPAHGKSRTQRAAPATISKAARALAW
ncbi:hypothetical protein NQ023_11965 [Corynebacterium phoceense]|uniref:hypothetical protein n=1 Tax=Corynebacterium phoceense TaxID=1686286 RepID=UPI00211CB5BD|nr:hypothetical protein [Corynebacterium phoceense]MCQ9341757.1 hypothetical protein [Corynebacterium phoceense]MCQ9349160.1 hypothetical protein [Corynebacterium phoceense]